MDEIPLGDELADLAKAVSEWTRQNFPAPTGGISGSTCEWCPLCQFMAVLRGERPELTERVAELGATMLGAVRTLSDVAAAARPRPSKPEGPAVEEAADGPTADGGSGGRSHATGSPRPRPRPQPPAADA